MERWYKRRSRVRKYMGGVKEKDERDEEMNKITK